MIDTKTQTLNVWRPCKDKPDERLLRKTLSLVRELIHQTFSEPNVTRCVISVRPSAGDRLRLSIYTDRSAFARIFGPASCVIDLVHHEDMRAQVSTWSAREWCELHAKVKVVRGWFEISSAVLEVCDALIPPQRMRLELHGRPVPNRQPIRSLTLRVGDAVAVGNLYELPSPLHPYHAVKPLILYRGVPIGPCSVGYQFNVLTGVQRLKSSEWMNGLDMALVSHV